MAETEDFFSTPELAARLDLIRHLIENSELVPLVRGPSGIGKTLLASRLQALAPDNWVVCHFSADSMMQPERLLAHIARCSGLSETPGDTLTKLVERFELLRNRGNVPVLLVDDVQTLPPTSLITLLRLYERQLSGSPLVSLVLFGDEQIDMLLSTPQLQIMTPQAIQVIDLPSLTREEADGFMEYLLRFEGLSERFRLDESKLNRIYRETRGVPGPLASAILDAVGEHGETPSASQKRLNGPLLFGGIATVIVLGLVLLFQGPINRLFVPEEPPGGDASPAISSGKPGSQGPERSAITGRAAPSVVETPPQLPEPPKGAEAPSTTVEPAGLPANGAAEQAPSLAESPDTPVKKIAKTPVEPEPAPKVEPVAPIGSVEEVSPAIGAPIQADMGGVEVAESQSPVSQEAAPVSAPKPHSVELVEEADHSAEAQPEAPSEVVQAEPDRPVPPASPPVGSLAKPPEKAVLPLSRSRKWVMAQAPASYTIQLLAVENIESIQAFIDHHALGDEAFTFETKRNGKPWYPLLWGVYPDRSAVDKAIKQLPSVLRKGGAWARTFASLQK